MEAVRNFINIIGLADEDDLPDPITGQQIQYSETETIFLPEDQPDICSIFQVMIEVKLNHFHTIKTPSGYSVVLDGIKKLKLIYKQKDLSCNAGFLEIETPFNTFAEVKNAISIDNINLYILDAYFDLLDKRKIYSHTLYLLHVAEAPFRCNSASLQKSILDIRKNSTDTPSSGQLSQSDSFPVIMKSIQSEVIQITSEMDRQHVEVDSDDLKVEIEAEYL